MRTGNLLRSALRLDFWVSRIRLGFHAGQEDKTRVVKSRSFHDLGVWRCEVLGQSDVRLDVYLNLPNPTCLQVLIISPNLDFRGTLPKNRV